MTPVEEPPYMLAMQDLKNVANINSVCRPNPHRQDVWERINAICRYHQTKSFMLTNYEGWFFDKFNDDSSRGGWRVREDVACYWGTGDGGEEADMKMEDQYEDDFEEYLPEVQQESNDNVAGPSNANNGPLQASVTQIYPQPPVASTSSAAAVRPPAAAPARARTPEPIYPYPLTQSAAAANLGQPAQPPAPAAAPVAQPAPQPAPTPASRRTPSLHPAVTAGTPAARKHLHLPLILPLLHRHPCLPLHPFENPPPRRLNACCWFRRPKGRRHRRVRRWGAIWLCLHRMNYFKLHIHTEAARDRIGIRLRLQGLVIPPLSRPVICALRHRVVWW
ncbi:hypothetical protein M422DRAFT_245728 [Sphaerobolus stellatus SS14]|nr:hypothetical protein M422DRAFT_245728 [Sphaerobolus stellatus SS14]